MNIHARYFLVLMICLRLSAQDKPKLAKLDVTGDMLTVDGFWEPDNPTKQNEVVPTAIHIQCFRHGGKEATLTKTESFCIIATATAASGVLMADSNIFGALWSDDEVVITDDVPICLTSRTFFDLKRKTVTGLDIRKPEATGLANTCKLLPDRQSYYLRERVDYWLFHQPVKK